MRNPASKKFIPIRFTGKDPQNFSTELKKRVDAYFIENDLPKQGDWKMIVKAVLFLIVYFGIYFTIIFGGFPVFIMLLLAILMGIMTPLVGFSIGHDATHGCLHTNPKINRIMGYSWDLIGLSSKMFTLRHNISHHAFANVENHDSDIDQGSLLRLSPFGPIKNYHRYQHLYATFLYGFLTLKMLLVKDFETLMMDHIGNRKIKRQPFSEWLITILTKAWYIGYTLVIPLLVLPIPWWQVLIGYLALHFAAGVTTSFSLVGGHLVEGSSYLPETKDGEIPVNWILFQFHCTADFESDNKWFTWLMGGMNAHLTHHLFPQICHKHFPAITQIIQSTAKEYGVTYRNHSLWQMFLKHFAHLKALGRPEKNLMYPLT